MQRDANEQVEPCATCLRAADAYERQAAVAYRTADIDYVLTAAARLYRTASTHSTENHAAAALAGVLRV